MLKVEINTKGEVEEISRSNIEATSTTLLLSKDADPDQDQLPDWKCEWKRADVRKRTIGPSFVGSERPFLKKIGRMPQTSCPPVCH
jgi:hypothetical protein